MPRTLDETATLDELMTALRVGDGFTRKAAAEALRQRDEPGTHLSPEHMLFALLSDITDVRAEAAELLGELGGSAPVSALLGGLGDPHNAIRSAAARGLATLAEQGVNVPAERVVPLLGDPVGHVRCAALRALGDQAPAASVLAALRDPDWAVRDAAAYVAGQLSERLPLERVAMLLLEEAPGVRESAARALAQLGTRAPVEPLLAALADTNAGVRRSAVEALANLGAGMPTAPLRALLHDLDEGVRLQAAKALARRGEPDGVAAVIGALRAADEFARENALSVLRSGYDAERALRELSRSLPASVLLGLLRDPYWPVAIMAGDVVAAQGEDAPNDVIVSLLDEGDPVVRQAALHALGLLGDRAPLDVILGTLDDEDANVRQEAIAALEGYGERVPLDVLIPFVAEGNVKAARLAARQGSQEGIDCLVARLRDLYSRWEAACALGELGERAPVAPLVAALGGSDSQVRYRAAEALHRTHTEAVPGLAEVLVLTLRGERIAPFLEPIRQMPPILGLQALAYPAPAFVSWLTEMLDARFWEVRMQAALALESLHAPLPPATMGKMRALQTDSESSSVRQAADRAIERLGRADGDRAADI